MKLISIIGCYVFAVACSSPSPPSTPTPASGEPTPPPVTSAPRTSAPQEITITSITAANPLVIEGRARTFENNVAIRLRDSRGALIRETFTTASGEMGEHNPYRAEVFVTRDPGSRITVEALEYSAKDGSERSLVSQSVAWAVEGLEADLYLPDMARSPTDCSRVFAERVEIPRSVAMGRLLVESLMAHPRSPFPQGAAVNSMALRDGMLTVDFNERLQNVGGSCAAQAIRASVEKTLLALPTVTGVRITAGGSERLALQP